MTLSHGFLKFTLADSTLLNFTNPCFELSLIESLISLWVYFLSGQHFALLCYYTPSSLNLLSSQLLLTCLLSWCNLGLTSLIYYIFMGNAFLPFSFVSLKRVFFWSQCIKIYLIQVIWGQSFSHCISRDLVKEFTENHECLWARQTLGSVFLFGL